MSDMIKCVVWDLDNTIWDGILSEDENVSLKPWVGEMLDTLDQRGIIHSIASRNNQADALRKLKELSIDQYFLYPQIHWGDKSESIQAIQQKLNIAIGCIAFIDDQPAERHEVQMKLPDVYCLDAEEYETMIAHARFIPEKITEDAKMRRLLYQQEQVRAEEEEKFGGNNIEFLRSLQMELLVTMADEEDLARAEELTLRTNQLNATGKTYDYNTLAEFIRSDRFSLCLCELKDRFGSYGKIGLVLLNNTAEDIHIEMMLFSCRVISRGIGTAMICFLNNKAGATGRRLTANFRDTGRNRNMFMTYAMAGFQDTAVMQDDCRLLVMGPDGRSELPPYLTLLDQTKI
ncbi:MAG: HAD-IIIC family phosphatase [Chitinophagaceae bacterium]